ncbi:MAG: hypothetical protein V4717_21570 [Bacteroidota bacterium]
MKYDVVPIFAIMRKWFLLIISFCYIASSSGVAVQWHYCMGKLRSVDLGISAHEETCGKCGMEKKENACCNDSVQITKLTDDHQQSNYTAFNFLRQIAAVPAPLFGLETSFSCLPIVSADVIYPPPALKANRNILFCVFRC